MYISIDKKEIPCYNPLNNLRGFLKGIGSQRMKK